MFRNMLCWLGLHNWLYGKYRWTRVCWNCKSDQYMTTLNGFKIWNDK